MKYEFAVTIRERGKKVERVITVYAKTRREARNFLLYQMKKSGYRKIETE